MRVLVWNEFLHEQRSEAVREIYPNGIHAAVAAHLGMHDVRTATLQEPEHGLSEAVLDDTDVLVWWGHLAHDAVSDEVAARVHARVLQGMGLVVLHSGHLSKIFTRLMGTTCHVRWREAEDRELVWCVAPEHPIAQGVHWPIELPEHEMYGELFDIPAPDELVLISNFSGGEVFRSGCCFRRGKGRIFYFSPGHETYPIYHREDVGRVIDNAVRWAFNPTPSAVDTTTSPMKETGWFRPS